MEPKSSLFYSQAPATGHYTEPDESNPHFMLHWIYTLKTICQYDEMSSEYRRFDSQNIGYINYVSDNKSCQIYAYCTEVHDILFMSASLWQLDL
jgi:hypothetical protein